MEIDTLKRQLIMHEGLKLKPYRCSAGRLTIGVGRNVEYVGISEAEALFLLDNDIKSCFSDLCEIFCNFDDLPNNIQHVLIDMRFNLGPSRFRKFKKMIAAVKSNDWQEMIVQMKDSAWYHQVASRAEALISMVWKV